MSRLKFWDRPDASQPPEKPCEAESLSEDESEDVDTYIKTFVDNGLRLHEELMVNHEAIDAARRESTDEFHRKRQG
ncbi:MAG: hypothetical protein AABN95_11415 [Acidobacteriota bacterium]